ncbi:MAG: hypothetical protein Q8R02_23480 [Hyphomonadaceae bacterium]|nr:hypothetical protein [Hyphomonadaceae bacterium]
MLLTPSAKLPRPRMGTTTLPAPVRGLNLHDGLANQKPDDALILDNWFPETTYCKVRGGYSSHATGVGAAILSHMEWAGPTSRKAFAAKTTDIYEVTAAGAVGAAAVSSLTVGYWQHVNFTTAGGSFLVLANGSDDVRNYDGTSWTSPAITGVTSSTLITPVVHKSRLWFIQNGTTKAWYLPASSIAGAATGFQLGEQFAMGGYLAAAGVVSSDGGSNSTADYMCFISSKGEVAIYAGADPADAATWSRQGIYKVAAPIGRRCAVQIGGDLAILTESGIVSMRQVMSLGKEQAERGAITYRIDRGISDDYGSYSGNSGWEMILHSRTHQLIVNVPTSSSAAKQYAMNIQTGSWCTYSGLNATCWGLLNGNLYFGSSAGTVWRAETGYQDNGAAITAELKTSFQPYGPKGRICRITQARPLFTAGGRVVPALRVDVDFKNTTPSDNDKFPVSAGSMGSSWDVGLWDTATWGDTDSPYADWISVTGIGTTAALHLRTQTNGISVKLNAIDVQYESSKEMAL